MQRDHKHYIKSIFFHELKASLEGFASSSVAPQWIDSKLDVGAQNHTRFATILKPFLFFEIKTWGLVPPGLDHTGGNCTHPHQQSGF